MSYKDVVIITDYSFKLSQIDINISKMERENQILLTSLVSLWYVEALLDQLETNA